MTEENVGFVSRSLQSRMESARNMAELENLGARCSGQTNGKLVYTHLGLPSLEFHYIPGRLKEIRYAGTVPNSAASIL